MYDVLDLDHLISRVYNVFDGKGAVSRENYLGCLFSLYRSHMIGDTL